MLLQPEKNLSKLTEKKDEKKEAVKNHYERMKNAADYYAVNQDHPKIHITSENSNRIISNFKSKFIQFKTEENQRNTDEMLAEQLQLEERNERIRRDYWIAREFAAEEAAKLLMRGDATKPSNIGFENDITVYMMRDNKQSQKPEQSSITEVLAMDDFIDSITAKNLDRAIQHVKKEKEDSIQQAILGNPTSLQNHRRASEPKIGI